MAFGSRKVAAGGAHASTHDIGGADEIAGMASLIDYSERSYTGNITTSATSPWSVALDSYSFTIGETMDLYFLWITPQTGNNVEERSKTGLFLDGVVIGNSVRQKLPGGGTWELELWVMDGVALDVAPGDHTIDYRGYVSGTGTLYIPYYITSDIEAEDPAIKGLVTIWRIGP